MTNSSDFVTQLKGMIREQINNIHTAVPGEIQSVDSSAGTVTVQPQASMIFSTGETLNYPVLNDVPVIMPFTDNGDASIVFPIHEGDQCLLIFSEQALETWLGTGNIGSQLKHSLSGALCLPGLMKAATDDFTEAVNDNAVIIREGKSKIKITNDGVEVTTDGTVQVDSKGDTTVNSSGGNVDVSVGASSIEVSSSSVKLASGAGSIEVSSSGALSFSATSVSGLGITGSASGGSLAGTAGPYPLAGSVVSASVTGTVIPG